jgi:hypothetical protein
MGLNRVRSEDGWQGRAGGPAAKCKAQQAHYSTPCWREAAPTQARLLQRGVRTPLPRAPPASRWKGVEITMSASGRCLSATPPGSLESVTMKVWPCARMRALRHGTDCACAGRPAASSALGHWALSGRAKVSCQGGAHYVRARITEGTIVRRGILFQVRPHLALKPLPQAKLVLNAAQQLGLPAARVSGLRGHGAFEDARCLDLM